MTISEMLSQSGLLTLLGMSVVFLFIIIMILCMNLLRILVRVLKLDKEKSSDKKANSTSDVQPSVVQNAVQANDDSQIIAAIAAAVHDKELRS